MTQEIQVPLTQDEHSILLIAAEGGSIAPIGKWKDPVLNLHRRGLLRRLDDMNYVGTEAGNRAGEELENENLRALIHANNAVHNQISKPRDEAMMLVDQAAQLIRKAAEITAPVSGHELGNAIDQWAMAAARKAKEMTS